MLQEPATFGPELDPAVVLGPAGVDPSHADARLPAQVVDTGVPQILVPVERGALGALRPDFAALEALLDEHAAATLYLRAVDGDRASPAVALRRPGRGERGPGDRLRRRPAHGLPPRAPRPRGLRSSRASRWAAQRARVLGRGRPRAGRRRRGRRRARDRRRCSREGAPGVCREVALRDASCRSAVATDARRRWRTSARASCHPEGKDASRSAPPRRRAGGAVRARRSRASWRPRRRARCRSRRRRCAA